MKYANLIAFGAVKNQIFAHQSRDNCNYHFYLLREKLKELNIEINTPDKNIGKVINFEIHIDIPKISNSKNKKYLLLWETNAIWPMNKNHHRFLFYDRVFTWDDNLVKRYNLTKFFLPFNGSNSNNKINLYAERSIFICMIAANKNNKSWTINELYNARYKTIEWYELNYPELFTLYGPGWDERPRAIVRGGGMINNIIYFLFNKLKIPRNKKLLKTYKGVINCKSEILLKAKFAICYENINKLEGYITEKIFDCFVSGCVPVYLGASNIKDYIPNNCYIDRRKFKTEEQLLQYLKSISEKEFHEYQVNIKKFLKSEKYKFFTDNYFVNKIIENL